MAVNFTTSLPPHGVPMLIPEIISAGADLIGKSVRIVGRVDHYDASRHTAQLSEPNRPASSPSVKLTVDTRLTDGSDYRLGSQILLIGELENSEDSTQNVSEGGVVLKARVSSCADRLDYALYCKALGVWRTYDSAEAELNMPASCT